MNNPILFTDIESTSLNWHEAEIITARFELYDDNTLINEYDFCSQVNKWNADAALIHKITYNQMLAFPSKAQAMNDFLGFIKSLSAFDICLFCNPNQFGEFYHYDLAVIQFELMNFLEVDRIELQPFQPQNIINVYKLAKEAELNGFFDAIKNDSGKKSYSQENIYKALFDESYDAHNAFDDVQALKRIYFTIKSFSNKNKKQLELI